jgi:hypothetical protein
MTLDASEDVGPPYRTLRYHTESAGYLYCATSFIYGPTC